MKTVAADREWGSDALLADRASAGDQEAFAALIEPRLARTLRTARAILGNDADALDATQDAFVSAWVNLPKLRDAQRFDAWLQRMLVNRCRDILRQRQRSREFSIATSDRIDATPRSDRDFSADGGDFTAEAVARAGILAAFERLSAADRHIVVLHHLHGLPVSEVALQLGIPIGTAKSRLHAARRALERALEAQR